MARKVTLQNASNETLYPKTTTAQVEGLESYAKTTDLANYTTTTDVDAAIESAMQDVAKTTDLEAYAKESDIIKPELLSDYFDYGMFKINDEVCNDSHISLVAGKTYKLSGYLNGDITIDGGTNDNYDVQLIFDNVHIISDTEYVVNNVNATGKTVISLTEGSNNYVETVAITYPDVVKTAAFAIEHNCYVVSGKNSVLEINNQSWGHGFKCHSLILQGAGKVIVTAQHDAFHATTGVLRVDSGSYEVVHAKDAFGAGGNDDSGYIQILGGDIKVVSATESVFDSKGAKGVIVRMDKFESIAAGEGLIGGTMTVLETAEESISTYYTGVYTSLIDYYGSPVVKKGYVEGCDVSTLEDVVAVDGIYDTQDVAVYIKGYIEGQIILPQKADLFIDGACVVSDNSVGTIYYNAAKKKMSLKGFDDTINIFKNTGAGCAIYALKNLSIQSDGNYYFIADTGHAVDSACCIIRGDGFRYFKSNNPDSDLIMTMGYIGADEDAVADVTKKDATSFSCDSIQICGTLETHVDVNRSAGDTGVLNFTYGQMGAVVVNKINAISTEKFVYGYNARKDIIQSEASLILAILSEEASNVGVDEEARSKAAEALMSATEANTTASTLAAQVEDVFKAMDSQLVDLGYKVTFDYNVDQVQVKVFRGKIVSMEEVDTADTVSGDAIVSRNKDLFNIPTKNGEGQINFQVIPLEGYEIVSVEKPETGLKNLKNGEDVETGLDSTIYRGTKVSSDITITITSQATVA